MSSVKLRVVVVGVNYEDSMSHNLSHSLKALGHEVVGEPKHGRIPGFTPLSRFADRIMASMGRAERAREKWVLEIVAGFRPHLVLCPTVSLTESCLARLKSTSDAKIVCWWGDPPANLQRMELLSGLWDHIFFKDAAAVEKFRMLGLKASLLHEAMNPEWHRPQGVDRNSHLVAVGNMYGYRQKLLGNLINRGFKVKTYGAVPPIWSTPQIKASSTGKYVVALEKAAVFEGAAVVVNNSALSEGDSLNCRIFEAAGAGALQICNYRPSIKECFEPGEEILAYQSFEECLDFCRRAVERDPRLEQVRRAGRERAVQFHTYEHRLKRIFETVL